MRGRPPKPPHLTLVTGTARGKKSVPPPPSGPLAAAPAHLTPPQVELWNYHVRHAAPGQLLATVEAVFTSFIVASDLHRQAIALVGDELVIESITGVFKVHPALMIVNAQAAIMLRAGAELGFTPASRGRITAEPDNTPDEFFPAG